MTFSCMKRFICVSVCVLILCGKAGAEDESFAERYFAAPPSYNTEIELPDGKKIAYYAQNDLLWGDLIYEKRGSGKHRPFRDSGCAPSALAMALRRVVKDEELIRLSEYAKRDFSLCECSLNEERCTKSHARYYITSVKDYVRFLPLVLGDFACGNNTFGIVSRDDGTGTGTAFYKAVAGIFGLEMTVTENAAEAANAANAGLGVVLFAGAGGTFTNTGHYMLLAGADSDYYYYLDPLCRTSYRQWDSHNYVNILDLGLLSVKKSNLHYTNIYSYIIFSPAAE